MSATRVALVVVVVVAASILLWPSSKKEPVPCDCPVPTPAPPPRRIKALPTIHFRADLGTILEQERWTVGVELGVQQGLFSKEILSRWASVKEYVLVDLWAQQTNYHDNANVDNTVQEQFFTTTMSNVEKWKDKIRVCRNFTTVCAKRFPDGYFDFIYVDARHDWKGVYEDLHAWWPKLRAGGIMAGHDYVVQAEIGGQDWTLNFDGTKDETGLVVKGAVDTFFMSDLAVNTDHYRQVVVTYRENMWNTWYARK